MGSLENRFEVSFSYFLSLLLRNYYDITIIHPHTFFSRLP